MLAPHIVSASDQPPPPQNDKGRPTVKLRIGDILLQEGLLTPEQLEQALAVQKTQPVSLPLGEVCVELKFLSRSDLNKLLRAHHKRIYLGELLANLGLVTEAQVREALQIQKTERKKLGQVLVEKGWITEANLINTLSLQLGVPKITPNAGLIDRQQLKGTNPAFLRKNEILPAFKQGDELTVIMADPLNEDRVRELEKTFRCRIQPAIAAASDIQQAITACFQTGNSATTDNPADLRKTLIIGQTNLSTERGDNIVEILNYLISDAVAERASDIHVEPQESCLRVRYRIDGMLHHKTDLPLFLALSLTSRIKVLCGLDIAEKRRHQDGRIEARVMNVAMDLRVSTYAAIHGESVVIRILLRQSALLDMDALGFSPVNRARYQKLLECPAGVILVTGPTGSGKTTTLYASLNHLNDLQQKIITVEDPVEYTIPGIVHGKLDPKLGHTYSEFLKAMMRQDPDVLMVGEIRDRNAAEAVIQAALTGHKVLSTFHTDDTIGALLRLMDMGIETFLISSTVVSVVAQRLVRSLCPRCREPHTPDKDLLAAFHAHTEGVERFTFHRPTGCAHCKHTGYRGRTAIHEVLGVNDSIRDCILARQPSAEIRLHARTHAGLISMREDGFYKATKGITSLEEVVRVVFNSESDALQHRSAAEIVALCEGTFAGDTKTVSDTVHAGCLTPLLPIVLTVPGEGDCLEGEAYRIRFECGTIESEQNRIAEFFQAYRQALERVNQPFDPFLVEDFLDFITSTVKRLKTSEGAEFVEFSLHVKDGNVLVWVETEAPRICADVARAPSREAGLRLLNYLR